MYTKSERSIYKFWNGEKNIRMDPMAIWSRLLEANPEFELDGKKVQLLAKERDPESSLTKQVIEEGAAAYQRLINAARKAFKVKEYVGDDNFEEGMTDLEVFELATDFGSFMGGIQKKIPG